MRFKKNVIVIFNSIAMRTFELIESSYGTECATDPMLTSGMDGTHGENSLHYRGLAWDFSLPLSRAFAPSADEALRERAKRDALTERIWRVLNHTGLDYAHRWDLGGDKLYDVVLEATHVHVEYDPASRERR